MGGVCVSTLVYEVAGFLAVARHSTLHGHLLTVAHEHGSFNMAAFNLTIISLEQDVPGHQDIFISSCYLLLAHGQCRIARLIYEVLHLDISNCGFPTH